MNATTNHGLFSELQAYFLTAMVLSISELECQFFCSTLQTCLTLEYLAVWPSDLKSFFQLKKVDQFVSSCSNCFLGYRQYYHL